MVHKKWYLGFCSNISVICTWKSMIWVLDDQLLEIIRRLEVKINRTVSILKQYLLGWIQNYKSIIVAFNIEMNKMHLLKKQFAHSSKLTHIFYFKRTNHFGFTSSRADTFPTFQITLLSRIAPAPRCPVPHPK